MSNIRLIHTKNKVIPKVAVWFLGGFLPAFGLLGAWIPDSIQVVRASPLAGQGDAAVDAQALLQNLKALVGNLQKLKKDMTDPASPAALPLNRKKAQFDEYSRGYAALATALGQANQKLREYYGQLEVVYRAQSKDPIYQQVRQAYMDADAAYKGVNEEFQKIKSPQTTQTVHVVSGDQRLNDKVTEVVGEPAVEVSVEQLEEAEVSYLGNFNSVDLFLVVKDGNVFYLTQGRKEKSINLTTPDRLLQSDCFRSSPVTVGDVQNFAPEQHLDVALKLKMTPIDTKGEKFVVLNEFLAKIKSYSRSN